MTVPTRSLFWPVLVEVLMSDLSGCRRRRSSEAMTRKCLILSRCPSFPVFECAKAFERSVLSMDSPPHFKTETSSIVLRELQEFSASPNVFVAVELSHQCRVRPEDLDSLERLLRLHQNRISSISLSPRSSRASVSAAPLDAETADIGDLGTFKLCRVLYESPGFSSALRELHLVGMLAFSLRGF